MYQHIVSTMEDGFVVRPWGGRMCFLGLPETVNCKKLGVTAIIREQPGLVHEDHFHDDSDEIICILKGRGIQSFTEPDGSNIAYEAVPGDVIYIAKNRLHGTRNLSPTEDLELFIVNYFVNAQSDVTRKGFVPFAATVPLAEPYGNRRIVISEETCGNRSIESDYLTVNPGACFEDSVCGEAFLFVTSGSASISYSGSEGAHPLHSYDLAFFHSGEIYRFENTGSTPAIVFRTKTL